MCFGVRLGGIYEVLVDTQRQLAHGLAFYDIRIPSDNFTYTDASVNLNPKLSRQNEAYSRRTRRGKRTR